ncbi:MAG: phosphate ABC transporter permease PstA [Saprospiraceae bacterium]|nr:phosphate ABC transporter permease PstA [Saprospiraceae bacterium]MDW8485314.1 phosphate ABC transporter permease PstA [Saprospiraceae bacterium]
MNLRTFWMRLGLASLVVCTLIVVAFMAALLFDLSWQGIPVLSWEFLTEFPQKGMTEGGIWPAIFGTTAVTLLATLLAAPLGVACAVWLEEYAGEGWLTQLTRAAVRNLAGVPSIVYGLFGLALFVQGMRMGASVLASACTLALLTLPAVIATTQEALRQVPRSLREGALALGATRWETTYSIVLPAALPGILTGVILALSRAAGETAPILFTGVAFYTRYLPASLFDEFMALPYHLYILATQHHEPEAVRPIAYGTAITLLLLVFLLNLGAFILRAQYHPKKRL